MTTPARRLLASYAASLLLLLLLSVPPAAQTAPLARDLGALKSQMQSLQADAGQLEKARAAGKEAARFCAACHGGDGISTRPHLPNLAGQNPEFLLKQTVAFATGERKDLVMNDLMSNFSNERILNLVLYYAGMPREQHTAPADAGSQTSGSALYQQRCLSCHGADGRGGQGHAWIAGQKPAYLEASLKRFRDPNNKRNDPVMGAVTKGLTDAEINAVAAYISSLK
jgi:cytochrome c553